MDRDEKPMLAVGQGIGRAWTSTEPGLDDASKTTGLDTVASGDTQQAPSNFNRIPCRGWLYAVGIALLAIAAFCNGLNAPFTFDDIGVLIEDVDTHSFASAWHGQWSRRVPMLTFAANYIIHQKNPWGYRIVNIAIHACAGMAMYGLAAELLRGRGVPSWLSERHNEWAALIAAIWVAHPLQTESVTYIVQRIEALGGLFILLTLLALAWSARSSFPKWCFALAAVSGLCAFQSKETSFVLPALALSMDWAFLSGNWRETFRRRWFPHAVLAGGACLLALRSGAFDASPAASAGFGMRNLSSWEYLRSQPGVIFRYIEAAFWPVTLCFDYQWAVATSPWEIYGLGAAILLMVGTSLYLLWRLPPLGWTAFAFFLLLAPTSSIVPIKDLAVEHRMYLPVGPLAALSVVAIAAGLYWAGAGRERAVVRWTAVAIGASVVVVLAARTHFRNRDYNDPIALWSKALAWNPANARARSYVVDHTISAGRIDEAIELLQESIARNPDNSQAHNLLGAMRLRQGDVADAERLMDRAISLKPDNIKALFNRGGVHMKQKEFSEAAVLFRKVVKIDPRSDEAWSALGWTLEELGSEREAIDCYRRALALDPQLIVVPVRLGDILATSGDPRLRNPAESLRLIESVARRIGGRNRYVLDSLAAAYAANGQFASAVKAARRALALPGEDEITKRVRDRLEAYERGQVLYRSTRTARR
jgi:tetratricopeptide (TPR) repeat protein